MMYSNLLYACEYIVKVLCVIEYYWVVELCKIFMGTSGHTDLKDAK